MPQRIVMPLLRPEIVDAHSAGFEAYRRLVNSQALRVGVVITVAVQVPFLLFEWLAVRDHFLAVQGLRALWLGPAVALYPFLKEPPPKLLRHIDGIILVIYVASAAFIVWVAFFHTGFESPYILALVMMFVGVGAVTLWPLWFAACFAVGVYGAYWTPLALGYGVITDVASFIGYQCFIVATMGIVLVSQRLRLQMARADFDRRCRLQDEKAQTRSLLESVAVMRQERLTWLENLARFLRHELKNQIVAVGTSIDLATDGESLEANRIYLGRARKSLDRMRGLVSSATEATSLEAALEADELERVDLSAMVAERVLQFQELHPESRLSLTLVPGLQVWGSEERLMQLLDKLLNNAIEHASNDGQIRVLLRSAGENSIELCVENEGEPLPDDRERIFEAFVSSQRRPENLGLGLFVARSIALNHGGSIRAEPLHDGKGARFVVQLPRERTAANTTSSEESRDAFPHEASPKRALTDSAD